MKKFYLVAGVAVLLLASCNTKKDEAKEVVAAEEIVKVDTHNAQNSLDVEGTYAGVLPAGTFEGKLPTASGGGGMEVKISLSGDTYKKSVIYIGKSDKPIETSGKFTWDETGSIITLAGENAPNKYFVGENTLTHLDMDGNKITGDLAHMYILKKK